MTGWFSSRVILRNFPRRLVSIYTFSSGIEFTRIEEKENKRRYKMRGAFTVWLSVQDNAAWLFGIASLFFDKLVKVRGIEVLINHLHICFC